MKVKQFKVLLKTNRR